MDEEILPRYEFFPVRTTTPIPVPELTVEPPRQILFSSAAFTFRKSAPTDFSTGIDSPVNADTDTNKSLLSKRYKSPQTISPEPINWISPGTTSSTDTSLTSSPFLPGTCILTVSCSISLSFCISQ